MFNSVLCKWIKKKDINVGDVTDKINNTLDEFIDEHTIEKPYTEKDAFFFELVIPSILGGMVVVNLLFFGIVKSYLWFLLSPVFGLIMTYVWLHITIAVCSKIFDFFTSDIITKIILKIIDSQLAKMVYRAAVVAYVVCEQVHNKVRSIRLAKCKIKDYEE
jgi:hypothetical protein